MVVALLGAVTLILYAAWRGKVTVADLKEHTNIFTALMVVGFAIKFIWFFVESGDPDASGDDLPAIFLLIVTILNRFM